METTANTTLTDLAELLARDITLLFDGYDIDNLDEVLARFGLAGTINELWEPYRTWSTFFTDEIPESVAWQLAIDLCYGDPDRIRSWVHGAGLKLRVDPSESLIELGRDDEWADVLIGHANTERVWEYFDAVRRNDY